DLHAAFEVFPLAVEPRGDPAGAACRGVFDPAPVAPGAEHDLWPRRPRPRGQPAAGELLAAPGLAHRVEIAHQRLEAGVVIGADDIKIVLGRAAAAPEPQSPAGNDVGRLAAMRQLDRVAHRGLQYAGAEL